MTPPAESRRTVTVLFADLVSSTTLGEDLDPEPLRALLLRYFDVCRVVIEQHGGTVEKFIGDAVMAVFGFPIAHEDDAIRAARAALDLVSGVRVLSLDVAQTWPVDLQVRVGLNTGEVVAAGDQSADTFISGDAVNVAARLQTAAPAGEVWVGGTTARMIRGAGDVEPLGQLTLKGKSASTEAFRLTAMRGAADVVRQLDAPLVGRQRELARLAAVTDALTRSTPLLVTVLGAAGIGKSRLVREYLASLDGAATVLRGKCLPYGQGVTYWAIGEILRTAAGITTGDSREEAIAKLRRWAGEIEHRDMILERVGTLIGLADHSAPSEELTWAVRKLLGGLAAAHPLVVVVDDIQWAEPELLDLLEQLIGLAGQLPIVALTMARPDLLDTRPGWAMAADIIRLDALPSTAAEEQLNALIASAVLSAPMREQVLTAAEGNPLFVEQFVAMLRDQGELDLPTKPVRALVVPPEMGALLAARLDHLPADEQRVLECASVIGRTFWWGSVADLLPDDLRARLSSILTALIRRGLLQPDASTFPGDEAFRFHHLLLLDAAYGRIPKLARARMHERFATWLESKTADRSGEFAEIVAHHALQAHHYFATGGDRAGAERSADLAFGHLVAAGRRALNRQDLRAVAALWGGAYELSLPERRRDQLQLLPDLAEALAGTGQLDAAFIVLDAALAAGDTAEPAIRSHLEIAKAALERFRSLDFTWQRDVADRWMPYFEAQHDDSGLAHAWSLRQLAAWMTMRVADADAARRTAELYAARAGEQHLAQRFQVQGTEFYGPMPADEAKRALHAELASLADDRLEATNLRFGLAGVLAMLGEFEDARRHAQHAPLAYEALGQHMTALGTIEMVAHVELIAGDPAAAESALRPGFDELRSIGNLSWFGNQLALLSIAVGMQGRWQEALRLADEATEVTSIYDVANLLLIARARSIALRIGNRLDDALVEVQRCVALTETTDALGWIGDAHLERARVLRALQRTPEARIAAEHASEAYRRKEHHVGMQAAAALSEELRAPQS